MQEQQYSIDNAKAIVLAQELKRNAAYEEERAGFISQMAKLTETKTALEVQVQSLRQEVEGTSGLDCT